MAQNGYVFRRGPSWFLRYWRNAIEHGQLVRRQKCVYLAAYSDRYRRKADLRELVGEELDQAKQADQHSHSSTRFTDYVEETYLPFVLRTKKPSTYAGYSTYWKRYLKPRVQGQVLRDFTIARVSTLLEHVADDHKLNRYTVGKVRSLLSAIFTYAIGKGHFPARSESDNPAHLALIPESATEPGKPKAATREEVKGILAALKPQPSMKLPELPLARGAVALMAMLGVRPGEARGLRWEDWDHVKEQVMVSRSVWHAIEGTPKTQQSIRYLAVSAELREVLLELWKEQGSPVGGYILAAPEEKCKPVILDNLAKRVIRPRLEAVNREAAEKGEKTTLTWLGWYSLRRFHGTAVRTESNLETSSRALGNSKAVADRHYVKPSEVLPDVRKAVNDAVSGLTDTVSGPNVVQRVCNSTIN
jgi:integrase